MYSIQEVAAATAVTSRTCVTTTASACCRRAGTANGYRAYEQADLVRLQRILMLRDLDSDCPEIARVLAGQTDDASALRQHALYLGIRTRADRSADPQRAADLEAIPDGGRR